MDILDRLSAILGNDSEIAKALNTSRQLVYAWRQNGFIPYRQGMPIQEATDGQITAIEVWQAAQRKQK